jgi:S1-C subfamily serine protease
MTGPDYGYRHPLRFPGMKFHRIATIVLLAAAFPTPLTLASPPVIDDMKIIRTLTKELGEAAESKEFPTADELAEVAKKGSRLQSGIPLPTSSEAPVEATYENLSRSVYLIATVYDCGKCDKWHQSSVATAWCVSEDGLMVTNAHVFANAKGGAMGVGDRDGRCYPVTELLGFDKHMDAALFRVKGKGLQALKLGPAAEVGAPVTVISHPAGNFFMRTEGTVSRYSQRMSAKNQPKVTWMSITADYAKGSSGGPVFNNAGEVVGMVSSTRSIYTASEPAKEKTQGHLQMVVKNCVPADAIRTLFGEAAEKQAAIAE